MIIFIEFLPDDHELSPSVGHSRRFSTRNVFVAYLGLLLPVAATPPGAGHRDDAFALIAAMAIVTVVYGLVQLVIIGVVPLAAQSAAPVGRLSVSCSVPQESCSQASPL